MAGRSVEIRGFTFTEISGTIYVKGSGIRGSVALGNVESLNIGMFQGLGAIPAIGAAAAEDLAAFTPADVAVILAALRGPAGRTAAEQPTEPPPAQTAATDAQAAQPANPIAPPVQKVDAAGTVVTPPATTAPSNADPVATLATAGGDQNIDPPVKTLAQTQATSAVPQNGTGALPAGPASGATGVTASGQRTNGVNQAGQAVGFGVRAEDGTLSNLRRNPETGDLYDPGGIASPAANIDPGVGDQDNNPTASTTDAQATVNATPPAQVLVKPQPNILDKFANYTYAASVYLLSAAQFAAYQLSEKKSVNGYNLLFQTGGAPNNIGGPQGALSAAGQATAATNADLESEGIGFQQSGPTLPGVGAADAGRNPFFPNDYYIDSIKITNKPFGKNTSAAHSVTDLKFTVIEPANISLIDNIYLAVQDIAPKSAGKVNYAAAIYLMVIRFYGYDLNGNLQQVGAADPATGLSDANALVEKYIPFRIKNINWGVSGKLVSYEFDCAPIGQLIAGGTKRGTIPADIELTGSSVSAMLKGQAVYGTAPTPATPNTPTTANRTQTDGRSRGIRSDTNQTPPSPPKATAAPNNKKTIQQGLIEAMNAEQQRLVQTGFYTVADQYELTFANGAKDIEDAVVAKPGKPVNKNATAVSAPASRDPSAASPDKGAMDTTSRSMGITAGMPLLQAIELVIRNSSYVTNQANIVINETTGKPEPKPGNENSDFKWYSILMQATPLEYDEKRNDFAYKIQYIVIPFLPSEMKSGYFPDVRFPGIFKRYPYWFTGENSAVLQYQATFNKMYVQTVTGSSAETSALALLRKKVAYSMRELPFLNYQSRSTESAMGADGRTNEMAANAAEYLYNPSDNASAKIKIIGDPAFIQQGSVAGALKSDKISFSPFAPDGTINFDVRDVLFEIVWQRPEDYDLETGIADPYARTKNIFGDRQPVQSIVYRIKEVVSNFAQGTFTQDIDATIYTLPIPQKTNTAVDSQASNNTPTTGDFARLDRAGTAPASVETQTRPPPGATTTPPPRSPATFPGRQGFGTTLPGGAAVGNPTISNSTRLGNPNINPGSLRDRAAQANAAREQAAALGQGQNGPVPAPNATTPQTVGRQTGYIPPTVVAQQPPQPPTSNGQQVGLLDRFLNRLAGQDPATGAPAAPQGRVGRANQNTSTQPPAPQRSDREF